MRALPAVAVVTFKGPGFPDTVIASTEPIVYVTVAVAVVAAHNRETLPIVKAKAIKKCFICIISPELIRVSKAKMPVYTHSS